jgi:serine/threonine protein kinase/WD40 repeat protein
MAANLQKARELFLHAVGTLQPEQWDGYVGEACGGDAGLEQQVGQMLQVHREAGSFLDRPAAALGAAGAFTALHGQQGPTVPHRERPGTVIGPYKLLQQIGEGGMGVVWMAEQTQPVQRKVALKVIKPGMDSQEVMARFEAERQALAMMDHVNIARVFDAGATESGRPYFVMELVHGVPITKYCDDNHLTPRERLELFMPVCQAIQHAHQKGIIHRDIKPSNVMITLYDGKPVPKVIDFGVAKATEQKLTERTLFTQYGTMVGTLEYMSPEQAEMSALGVDTRSDIYSLGVLLYELLTGSTPLSHKRVKEAAYGEVLRMIKEEEPPRPSTRLSESGEALASISAQRRMEPAKLATLLRGELDWIVMKTLEKDRNRRYETATGLSADVQRYLKDEAVLACPPSALYRFRKFARRNKGILATACVVVLTLVLGTGVSAWQAIQATQQAARATTAEGLAQDRLVIASDHHKAAEQAEANATHRLYRSLVNQARATRLSRGIGQRLKSLELLADAAKIARDTNLRVDFLELRNAAIACLALPDLRVDREWIGWRTDDRFVDFDGAREHYACTDGEGNCSIRRSADGTEIASLLGIGQRPVDGTESRPEFSRDGRHVAVWYYPTGALKMWKLGAAEHAKPVLLVEQASGVTTSTFSPDSRLFAFGVANGPLQLMELPSQQLRQLSIVGPHSRTLGIFRPKHRQIALVPHDQKSIQICDLDSGKVLATLPQPEGVARIDWHPDGNTLVVAGQDQLMHIWDVATVKQTVQMGGLKGIDTRFPITFNGSGDLLATSWDGFLRLWDPRSGEQVFHTRAFVGCLSFSPDGQPLLGRDDNKLSLLQVTPASGYRTLVRDPLLGKGEYIECASSPKQGRLLAVGMADGVGLWDAPSGKPLTFLPIGRTDFVLFEPSGALLTNGLTGVLRWPIDEDPATPGLVSIGTPQVLPLAAPIMRILSTSLRGRVLASAQGWGGLVWDQDRPGPPIPVALHKDARCIAVSPDGCLVATGSHWGTKVQICDARTGELKHTLPVETGTNVHFSPDGKWLATPGRGWWAGSGGGLTLWEVGTWKRGKQIGGGPCAFSPDGKLLAVEAGQGVVRLVDPESGREYARLEDPNPEPSFSLCFSRDGAQLVTTTPAGNSIHVWDLRMIRAQLVTMRLDWDLPAYPVPRPADAQPLQVRVDMAEVANLMQAHQYVRQALGFVRSKQWDKAIATNAKAIELDPKNCTGLNNLAWLLATCPDIKLRDPGRAVELAVRSCQGTPLEGYAWNTLGVAHYRAEDWQAAVAALTKSNELYSGRQLAFNAFFLAMAHWHLGHKDEARTWQKQAVQWMDKNRPRDEELRLFRIEASELIRP